jgi:peptide/nickel transport system ATP-binding protein
MADQLLVMHKGEIVERGDADVVYTHPEKEYTQQLIDAIPKGL